MTQDEIIEMARQAGWGFSNTQDSDFVKAQFCFAELIAAKEREACARTCEKRGMVKGGEVFAARIRARGQA
jgi:hypothetical protein